MVLPFFTMVVHRHGKIPTSAAACLFFSNIRVPYAIFQWQQSFLDLFICEMDVV